MHPIGSKIEARGTLNADRSNDIMRDRNVLVTRCPASTRLLCKRDDVFHACSLDPSVQ